MIRRVFQPQVKDRLDFNEERDCPEAGDEEAILAGEEREFQHALAVARALLFDQTRADRLLHGLRHGTHH